MVFIIPGLYFQSYNYLRKGYIYIFNIPSNILSFHQEFINWLVAIIS